MNRIFEEDQNGNYVQRSQSDEESNYRLGMYNQINEESNPTSNIPKRNTSLYLCRFIKRNEKIARIILSILAGQILGLFNAGTGISSLLLVTNNVRVPLTQNIPHLGLISITCLNIILFRYIRQRFRPLAGAPNQSDQSLNYFCQHWWKYLLASVMDVHGNWALVAAYQYTNMVSIQILDCFTIVTVVILSRIIFKTRYTLIHYFAIAGCMIGSFSLILVDVTHNSDSHVIFQMNKVVLFGDFMALLGATTYGVSNIIQQYLTSKNGIINYLAITSTISLFLNSIYAIIVERDRIVHLFEHFDEYDKNVLYYFIMYIVCMYFLYIVMSNIMKYTNAMFSNISNLSTDVYFVFLSQFFLKVSFDYKYLLAFFCILLCTALFLSKPPKQVERS